MGLLSTIKKVGRAIDPTSSTAPLGGVVRNAINSTDAGKKAMTAIDAAKGAKPAPPPAPKPPTSTSAQVGAVLTSGAGISTGLLLVAGLVALLFFMRRK